MKAGKGIQRGFVNTLVVKHLAFLNVLKLRV